MLLRELVCGDPPSTCKLIFLDQPRGFGHRVTDGGCMIEQVLTKRQDFEVAVAAKIAEGFAETERSLTRRVFVSSDRFWIVSLDGNTVRAQFGQIKADWRESTGQNRDKEFRDRDRAVAAYHRVIAAKLKEGYREQYVRPLLISETPTGPKQPSPRTSR